MYVFLNSLLIYFYNSNNISPRTYHNENGCHLYAIVKPKVQIYSKREAQSLQKEKYNKHEALEKNKLQPRS